MHKVINPRQTIAELDADVDSIQHSDDGEAVTNITSWSSTEYMPYTASTPLYATISISATSAAQTNRSLPPPSTPIEQFHAIPGGIIIGVVVGVVVLLLGVGLLLGERRRKRAEVEDHEISGIGKLSYDSGESAYVLQRAQTESVEIKRGVLVSIPSRGRVESS
jgi:hypothetical protein